MKKYILLLISVISFAQAPARYPKLSITSNVEDNSATKVNVQSTDGTINWQLTSNIIPQKKYKSILYDGDSMTSITDPAPYSATNYPAQLPNFNFDVARSDQYNTAVSGKRLSTFISAGQYVTNIQPRKPTSNKEQVVFMFMIGTNDLGDGRTPAQVYADLKTVWAQAKADKITVVAFCITRTTNATKDPNVIATNTLIASDPTLYDYLIRTDLILPNPADLTYFEADGLHLNVNGSKKVAQEISRTLISQINNYSSIDTGLKVLNGNTEVNKITATSFVKAGATATDALLAGGGTLPFPIGAGGTGVANFVPVYTSPGFIGLSKMAYNSPLTVLNVDSKLTVGLAPSYATSVGQFDIKTGSVLSYNLSGQDMGSFSFGNASGSANIPTMIGKSTDNRGIFFIAASPDANSAPDFELNFRRNTDSDYTTMTGGGFKIARQNVELFYLSRTGALKMTGLAGSGPSLLETDASGNIQRSSATARPYKVYTALLTQTGTSAPTATILENTLGGTVTLSRTGSGAYKLTLPSAVTPTKVGCLFSFGGNNSTNMSSAITIEAGGTYVQLATYNSGTQSDALMTTATVEIRVYN